MNKFEHIGGWGGGGKARAWGDGPCAVRSHVQGGRDGAGAWEGFQCIMGTGHMGTPTVDRMTT